MTEMDDAKLSIILVILVPTIGGYLLLSIILFVWPNLLCTKRKSDEEELGHDNSIFFERAVNEGQNVLEYVVAVSEDSAFVLCEDNKDECESETTPSMQENKDEGPLDPNSKTEKAENEVTFEDVLVHSKEAPSIITVEAKNEVQSSTVDYFIKKHNRKRLILLGSASTKTRQNLYQMDSYLPVFKKADWKLYACYFTGFLPFVSHNNSVLIITHCFRPKMNEDGNVSWFTNLRQWLSNMFLCSLSPMINHLKKKGVKTYLISINRKDYDKVPAHLSLRINEKPKGFTRDLLFYRNAQASAIVRFNYSTNVDTAENEALEPLLKNMPAVDTALECEVKPSSKSLLDFFGKKSKQERKSLNNLDERVHGGGSPEHADNDKIVEDQDDKHKKVMSIESAVPTDEMNPAHVCGSSRENKPMNTNYPTKESNTGLKSDSALGAYSTDVDNAKSLKHHVPNKDVTASQETRQVPTASDKTTLSSHQNGYSEEDVQDEPISEELVKNECAVDTAHGYEGKHPKKSSSFQLFGIIVR